MTRTVSAESDLVPQPTQKAHTDTHTNAHTHTHTHKHANTHTHTHTHTHTNTPTHTHTHTKNTHTHTQLCEKKRQPDHADGYSCYKKKRYRDYSTHQTLTKAS